MKSIFALSLVLFGSSAMASISGWDSRLDFKEENAVRLVEYATQKESEWSEPGVQCLFESSDNLELIDVKTDRPQAFVVRSQVTLGGPTCPGQIMDCETSFTEQQEGVWKIEAVCADEP